MAEHSMLKMTFPVLLPEMAELLLSKVDFEQYLQTTLQRDAGEGLSKDTAGLSVKAEPETMAPASKNRFMQALKDEAVPTFDDQDGKMLTDNGDVTFSTSNSPLVDLFTELEDVIDPARLHTVLDKAWAADSLATLKLIWNARSIHLGKGSHKAFYRAAGWLKENHPLTLLHNLPSLVRPVIAKKVESIKSTKTDESKGNESKGNDDDDDFEMIDKAEVSEPKAKRIRLDVEDDEALAQWDVKYGVSHAYWKDLLNMLALAVNGHLRVDGDPTKVLNVPKPATRRHRDFTQGQKKAQTAKRHERLIKELGYNPFYKALHISVARLFADQLRLDSARLASGDKAEIKCISLAAKWAPSGQGMHDQHTCIVSSIAELLYSRENVAATLDADDRGGYLLRAREAYQRLTLSPLRKHLQVVERSITAEKFEEIKYDRLPSLAMKQYTPLFAKKDFERFDKYLDAVAEGKSKISGAVLLPSTLVAAVVAKRRGGITKNPALLEEKLRDIQNRAIDGQWKALCKRIAESGTLASSIAVADVSGSMGSPRFADGTCPMYSAIGLGLLLAEVGAEPFGGAFITFSEEPEILRVGGKDDKRSFAEKVRYMMGTPWGGTTDFVAVFEKLILPLAIEHKLKQEDMVKRVFVFSDMHFNSAEGYGKARWSTSFERIKKQYAKAGYEMPELIFWNLAGGRNGTAPKPVQSNTPGTALVGGYSQGQLKMFLENGQFEDEEEEIETKEDGDGDAVMVSKAKAKLDPMTTVKKAISHDAYKMLKVVD